ncbi:MAG: hypothetical protein MJK04_35475, partial [Psychrosphaera sp.]|nr:hypothetical protein [Psychrosphaera sp.]
MSYSKFDQSSYLCEGCKLAYWPEASEYRFYALHDNSLWLSNAISGTFEPGSDEGTIFPFRKIQSLNAVRLMQDRIVAYVSKKNGSTTAQLMKFQDGQLVFDSSYFSPLSEAQLPVEMSRMSFKDINNDGKNDVVYMVEDQENHFVLVVHYRSDAGLGEAVILAQFDGSENTSFARLNEIKDVTNDGFVDIGIKVYNFETFYTYQWYAYDSQSGDYLILPQLSTTPNTGHTPRFGDINDDNSTDIVLATTDGFNCPTSDNACGVFQTKLAQSDGTFPDWVDMDQEPQQFASYDFADINRDGTTELVGRMKNWRQWPDPYTYRSFWYQWDSQGNFVRHTTSYDFDAYVDLLGENDPYFVDFTVEGQLRRLSYNAVIERPVIEEVQSMPTHPELSNRLMFDIDGDGDSDIIVYDDDKIYLIENTHNDPVVIINTPPVVDSIPTKT